MTYNINISWIVIWLGWRRCVYRRRWTRCSAWGRHGRLNLAVLIEMFALSELRKATRRTKIRTDGRRDMARHQASFPARGWISNSMRTRKYLGARERSMMNVSDPRSLSPPRSAKLRSSSATCQDSRSTADGGERRWLDLLCAKDSVPISRM